MRVEPLDWAGPWPYPWSRLEELALDAGVEVEELRAYLEAEVARRRAALEHLTPVVGAPAEAVPGTTRFCFMQISKSSAAGTP